MSADTAYPAPAKLNLMLRVTGRRADGYHLLQTVYRFIDYGDTLRFTVRTDGAITRANQVAGVAEADDLTLRAAALLQRAAGQRDEARKIWDSALKLSPANEVLLATVKKFSP